MTKVLHDTRLEPNLVTKLPRGLLFWFFGLSSLLLIGLFIFLSFAVFHWRTGFGRTLANWVPFPAAVSDGGVIWYQEVVELATVIDTQVSSDDLSDSFDRALSLAVRRRFVEVIADNLEVEVSKAELSDADVSGLEIFTDSVGWNEADYRRYVTGPLLLAQKTEAALQSSAEYQEIAKNKLIKVQEALEIGIAFADIANQYSEDPTAAVGGDMGYLERTEVPAGLESVFDLPVGQQSKILELPDGFAIALVYDVLEVDGLRSEVAVRWIKVGKATLPEVLDEYSKSRDVWYIVR